jgi:SEC-C motif
MQNPETEKQQKSVDRDRAQSHSIFHRCLAALRQVQTERGIRNQFFPESGPPEGLGLMDMLKVSKVKPFDPGPAPPQPAPTEPDASDDKMDAGMDALMSLAEKQLSQRFREEGFAGFNSVAPMPTPAAPEATAAAPMASNCKPAAAVPAPTSWFSRNAPRNAPCRCGSGKKFKRCCGNPAAQALNRAA